METADVFQTLGLGINFDKKRFGKDIALFEGTTGSTLDLTSQPRPSRGEDKVGEATPSPGRRGFPDSLPHVSTRDPHEEANVIRKLHRIRVSGSQPPPPLRTFAQLAGEGLADPPPPRLLRNLAAAGFLEPTPVQRQAIPALLARRELLALMAQSARVLALLLPGLGLRAALLSKATAAGTDFARVDVLLANPLRLATLAGAGVEGAEEAAGPGKADGTEEEGGTSGAPAGDDPSRPARARRLDMAQVRTLILDEADKLFDMGFTPQVDAVLGAATHPDLVRALFSATLPETVETMARSVLRDPLRVTVGERGSAAATVSQTLQFVGREAGKALALRQLLASGVKPPILVFVSSRERAKEVHRELRFDGMHVDCIHSDQSDAARAAAIASFRRGSTWVLVATDLLGRGMDFPGVNTVVNYDCPRSTTDYVHRVGRTGRAGRAGSAVTFFTEEDVKYLRGIANVVRASGSPVPDWMLALRKERWRKRAAPDQEVALEEEADAANGAAGTAAPRSQEGGPQLAQKTKPRPEKMRKKKARSTPEQTAPDRTEAVPRKPKMA